MRAPVSVTLADTSTQIFAVNQFRTGFYLKNMGAETVYISIGEPAEASKGIPLASFEGIQFHLKTTQAIFGIVASGGTGTVMGQDISSGL
jgi:hypothetical protein